MKISCIHSCLCMNWIYFLFSYIVCRMAVILLIMAQSNGNNLHTILQKRWDESFRMCIKKREEKTHTLISSISPPLKLLISCKIRPCSISNDNWIFKIYIISTKIHIYSFRVFALQSIFHSARSEFLRL